MVSYQKFVSIVFSVAEKRGSDRDSDEIISIAADLWNDEPDLKGATVSEARGYVERKA